MDFIRKQVDTLKKPFTKGGKLEKLYPAFNAFETMLFVPNHTTSKGSHIRAVSYTHLTLPTSR